MSKKDYIRLAEVMRHSVDGQKSDSHRVVRNANTIIYNIAQALCDTLQNDNSRFDRVRFLTACGIIELDACWCGSRVVHTHE